MNWELLIAIVSALGGTSTIAALYRWSKAQGKAEALADQSRKTIAAKDMEINELKAENRTLWQRNAQLWALLDALTSPSGRS